MPIDSSKPLPPRRLASGQTWLCIGILLAIALPHAIAQILMVHTEIVLPFRLPKWKALGGAYADNRFYDDADGTLLVDEFPLADYSGGGVYFIGASRLGYTLAMWESPPAERTRIHNYMMPASTHAQQGQLVRYLVDQRDLLKAGGDKNLVVLELYFLNADHEATLQEGRPAGMFRHMLDSTGLYSYDKTRGVDGIPMSRAALFWRIARFHDKSFFLWLKDAITGNQQGGATERLPHAPEKWRTLMDEKLGPDWDRGIDAELAQLAQTIDFLQAHRVHVQAVYMPQGTWFREYPPSVVYRQRAFALLRSKSVPFCDYADAVPDDRFSDSMHLGYVGVHEIRPKVMQIAEDFLRPGNPVSIK